MPEIVQSNLGQIGVGGYFSELFHEIFEADRTSGWPRRTLSAGFVRGKQQIGDRFLLVFTGAESGFVLFLPAGF